jgi:hypothetical protein
MAGEMYERFYDPEDRENSWVDTEPVGKSIKEIHTAISGDIKTKDELDVIESSLRLWSEAEISAEVIHTK